MREDAFTTVSRWARELGYIATIGGLYIYDPNDSREMGEAVCSWIELLGMSTNIHSKEHFELLITFMR